MPRGTSRLDVANLRPRSIILRMAKKITLASIAAQIEKMEARMEKGFGAVAEDLSKLTTKEQMISLHTQATSIETQLRGMKHIKLDLRVADLEEEVFGKTPA